MKRYIIFSHRQYYPLGGWSDSLGMFETIEDAKKCNLYNFWGDNVPRTYIVDLESERVIFIYDAGFWVDVSENVKTP